MLVHGAAAIDLLYEVKGRCPVGSNIWIPFSPAGPQIAKTWLHHFAGVDFSACPKRESRMFPAVLIVSWLFIPP